MSAGECIGSASLALEIATRAYRSGRSRDAIEGIDRARGLLLSARRKVNEERDAACGRR